MACASNRMFHDQRNDLYSFRWMSAKSAFDRLFPTANDRSTAWSFSRRISGIDPSESIVQPDSSPQSRRSKWPFSSSKSAVLAVNNSARLRYREPPQAFDAAAVCQV